MAKTEPLKASEIDSFVSGLKSQLETFSQRMKATIALAERGLELESALAKLTGQSRQHTGNGVLVTAPQPKTKTPAPASNGGRKRRKGLDPKKVLHVLRGAKTGLAVREISKAIGESNRDRIAAALLKLRDQKQVKSTGKLSTTRWHAAA